LRQAVAHLREVFEAMQPGIIARLQPDLDILERAIMSTYWATPKLMRAVQSQD
jgi:hypothetical protein